MVARVGLGQSARGHSYGAAGSSGPPHDAVIAAAARLRSRHVGAVRAEAPVARGATSASVHLYAPPRLYPLHDPRAQRRCLREVGGGSRRCRRRWRLRSSKCEAHAVRRRSSGSELSQPPRHHHRSTSPGCRAILDSGLRHRDGRVDRRRGLRGARGRRRSAVERTPAGPCRARWSRCPGGARSSSCAVEHHGRPASTAKTRAPPARRRGRRRRAARAASHVGDHPASARSDRGWRRRPPTLRACRRRGTRRA